MIRNTLIHQLLLTSTEDQQESVASIEIEEGKTFQGGAGQEIIIHLWSKCLMPVSGS